MYPRLCPATWLGKAPRGPELAMEKPFVVPTSFVYLAKSFSLIEGICLQLDPDFDYFTYLEPMIQILKPDK